MSRSANTRLRLLLASLIAVIACGQPPSEKQQQAPINITYGLTEFDFVVGVPISPSSPIVSGGTPTGFSVSPPLPTGLVLNPTNGVLSGTPSAPSTAAGYSVSASNALGSCSVTITIAVRQPPYACFDCQEMRHFEVCTRSMKHTSFSPFACEIAGVAICS